jgi:hypothetical protein
MGSLLPLVAQSFPKNSREKKRRKEQPQPKPIASSRADGKQGFGTLWDPTAARAAWTIQLRAWLKAQSRAKAWLRARALTSLKAWFKATAKARFRFCSGLKAWGRAPSRGVNPEARMP